MDILFDYRNGRVIVSLVDDNAEEEPSAAHCTLREV
jgi:hypothetical protein